VSRAVSPKDSGEQVEATVIQQVDGLEPAPGRDTFDARTTAVLDPRTTDARFATPLLEPETDVEIKAAQTRLASGRRGRWYVRKRQHERLLAASGAYLLVVYAPTFPTHDVRAQLVIPASLVDERLPDGWTGVDGDRAEEGYRQLAWSAFIDPDGVQEGR
jgi:hypothetical protein